MTSNKNRCVITGLGVVSAIGGNVSECWDSILAARSGIDHTQSVDTEHCYADYAAEVKNLEDVPELDRSSVLCLKAAR